MQQGLSKRDKGLIIFVILAVIIAAGMIYKAYQSQQPHITASLNLPPGSAPKLQAMKAMKEQNNASGNAAQNNNSTSAPVSPPGANRKSGVQ